METEYERYGIAGPCPLCGTKPSYDTVRGEYEHDFMYPLGQRRVAGIETGWLIRGAKTRLLHANCSETWGGCGHVVVGYSYEALIRDWNAYGPDLQVRFDLPGIEALVAEDTRQRLAQLEALQRWLESPNEDGSKRRRRHATTETVFGLEDPVPWWQNQETLAEIDRFNSAYYLDLAKAKGREHG